MYKSRRWVGAVAALLLTVALTPLGTPASADDHYDTPIKDPVKADPVPSSLGLVLEEYAQFPKTEPHPPGPVDPRSVRHARINYIGELPDGSGRLYTPDLNGPLYFVEDGEPHVYLDLKARFPDFYSATGLGSGAGFAAFHPEFGTNGKFYTVHTERFGAFEKKPTFPEQTPQTGNATHGVITEWTADDPAADSFSGSSREVMRIAFGHRIHGLQQIDFNPTAEPGDEDYGLLYIASGDGGLGVDRDYPQDLSNPYGKILRIDPNGSNGPNGEYGIPASNPHVGNDGAIGEIYANGMRDPHRFSWDTETGRMYLGHIGQHAVEGVYDVRAGDNLGWSEIEGRLNFRSHNQCYLYPLTPEQEEAGYTYPVTSFDHETPSNWSCNSDSGHAISGGFVYRGEDLTDLQGMYVFGDLVTGEVYASDASDFQRNGPREAKINQLALYDADGNRMRMPDFVDDGRIDMRFGTDADGNLYLLSKANGKVWKVVDTKDAPPPRYVEPALADHLVASYDFEHPFGRDDSYEFDQGVSNTLLRMIGGGEDQRVDDGAYPGSRNALQIHSAAESPNGTPWKAGIWDGDGAEYLGAFNGTEGITVMGWFKMTGQNPTPGYNAIGLAGVLSGDSEGHNVRALLELISVDGELRLVALGRRIDGGSSQTFAASQDWRKLLPQGEWIHLAATFDYTTGDMALYHNGEPLEGFYTKSGDPWKVDGSGTSPTDPRGIKIGGSFPQDTSERNPCNCRMDGLMFLDKELSAAEVQRQHRRFLR